METIHVNLREFSYPIQVTSEEAEWQQSLWALIQTNAPSQVVILTAPKVARYCLAPLKKILLSGPISFKTLQLPDGERFKTLSTVSKAYRGLVKLRADRSTLILLLGGGVLGDLGGFVASTFLRGLPFVQIPTTLVGQVDSSIGGKLGVDLPEGKNLIGVFKQPLAVFSHTGFLKTLPQRDLVGGLAEVLKYGVIGDASLFDLVGGNLSQILKRDPTLLTPIVSRSAGMKARIVEQDEKETTGLRMILNFGHTFGHAVERLTRYRHFHHGEAIAIGMVVAGQISQHLGFCTEMDAKRLEQTFREAGLPTVPPPFKKREWIGALEVDKKSRGGMIQFVVMKKIGEVTTVPMHPQDLVKHL